MVGISFQQTSLEALRELLALETVGHCETWIHHNEGGGTFHPKFYLFRAASGEGRLVVGSSNVTQGGLYTNVESSLDVSAGASSRVMSDASRQFDAWRTDAQLSRRIDATFLAQLVSGGYVVSEAFVPVPRTTGGRNAGGSGKAPPLFGSVRTAAPARPKWKSATKGPAPGAPGSAAPSSGVPAPTTGTGYTRLSMRVRPSRGHVQVQVPFKVAAAGFLANGTIVTSTHNRRQHAVFAATARGKTNTLKIEIPEVKPMKDPVVVFTRGAGGITYAAFDGALPGPGRAIYLALHAGINRGTTHVTKPKTPATAQWWELT